MVLTDLAHLSAGSNVGETEVFIVDELLDGAHDLALEDVLAEVRLLGERAGETDTVDDVESLDHCADRLEAAGDVGLCLGKDRGNQLGELEEEALALLGGLALVAEGKLLVGTARQLDKVELVLLKNLADLLGLLGVEALVLELNRVQLDADDEVAGNTLANGVGDLNNDAGAVLDRSAVLVGTLVGGGGKELGDQVAVGSVELDTVVASLLKVFCGVGKALNDIGNVLFSGGAGLLESHAHDVALKLNVAGRNGVLLNTRLDLASRVGNLTNKQRAVLLGLGSHLLERLETLTRELRLAGDDGVTGCLEVIILDHDVAGEDETNTALTPPPVQVDKVFGRHTTNLEVLRVPAGDTLSHGSLEEAVGCCLSRELELEGLTQGRSILGVGFETR